MAAQGGAAEAANASAAGVALEKAS
ncbi:MAG: hypothetical protein RIS70_2830, partial [Planctomycetota bacterium]